jgi:hypothetical protein
LSPRHAKICTQDLTPANIKKWPYPFWYPGVGPLASDHRIQPTLHWLGLKIPQGSSFRVGSSPTSDTTTNNVSYLSRRIPVRRNFLFDDVRMEGLPRVPHRPLSQRNGFLSLFHQGRPGPRAMDCYPLLPALGRSQIRRLTQSARAIPSRLIEMPSPQPLFSNVAALRFFYAPYMV